MARRLRARWRVDRGSTEARALGVIAALAFTAIAWVFVPVGAGVLMGGLLAFTAHDRFRAAIRRGHSPVAAALGLTATATMVVTGTLAVLGYLLVLRGLAVIRALPPAFASSGWVARIVPADVVEKTREAIGSVAASLASWAASAVGTAIDGVLALFFTAMTMFFVLRHGRDLATHAERLMPIPPHDTRRLLRAMRRLGRQVVVGNFGTGLVQGTLAGVGFWIAGLPQPAFLGAMTAVASLLPAVGTMLVWVPAAVVLLVSERVAAGTFVLAWSSLAVVGFCDYVVRPRLVGRGERMSTLTTFVSLFGGLKLFGVLGFLLGPMVVGLAIAALELYERRRPNQSGATFGPSAGPAGPQSLPASGSVGGVGGMHAS